MRAKSLLFGTTTTDSPAGDLGLLVLRVFAGLALALAHGWGKLPPSDRFVSRVGEFGFPVPELFAWLSGIAELGGLLLALGLLTRPVSLLIVLNMTVALLFAHEGDPFSQREKAFLFGFVGLLYLLAGAGRYSLDALIHRRRR